MQVYSLALLKVNNDKSVSFMTAYAWLFKQIVTEQTELVKGLAEGFYSNPSNVSIMRSPLSEDVFYKEADFEEEVKQREGRRMLRRQHIVNLFFDWMKLDDQELKNEMLSFIEEHKNIERKIKELDSYEWEENTDFIWYLLSNNETGELLIQYNQPIFVFKGTYWWGLPIEHDNNDEDDYFSQEANSFKTRMEVIKISDNDSISNTINCIENYYRN